MPRRAKKDGDPRVAVAYLRVSTDEQHLGPEAQRRAIQAWADREGIRIVAEEWDQGKSGALDLEDRPGLMRAIVALREHGAGVLIVARRDRLARSVEVAVALERAVRSAGAVVATADGRNDEGPSGKLVRQIEDALAEHERALISSRTRAALAVMRSRGLRTGMAPYGFRVVSEPTDGIVSKKSARPLRLELDPAEQEVCTLVMRMHVAGASERAIEDELKSRGIKSRRGHRLVQTQVHRIIAGCAKLQALYPEHAGGISPRPPPETLPALIACGRGHPHKEEHIGKLCCVDECGANRDDKEPRRIQQRGTET